MSELEQAVKKTVAYFDLFDYPLTALEIWRYLYAPNAPKCGIKELFSSLSAFLAAGGLEAREGFYFLPGRGAILSARQERYALSFAKYRRARRFAKIFSRLPGVRMVALGNTLAWRHARAASDIDFFIVAEHGHIWSVRFLCALLAAVLRARPTKTESADAICLSFFASSDSLNLQGLAIEGDIYFPFWIISLVPLYDAGGVFEKFKKANAWILSALPNAFFREPAETPIMRRGVSTLPAPAEKLFKKLQLYLLPRHISEKASLGATDVILSEQYLKFHTDDRRAYFRDAWAAKCREIL